MCLAVPGKITKIKEGVATVDYGSEKREAKIVYGEYKPGDYVIVQAKLIVDKVPVEQVQAWLNIVKNEG